MTSLGNKRGTIVGSEFQSNAIEQVLNFQFLCQLGCLQIVLVILQFGNEGLNGGEVVGELMIGEGSLLGINPCKEL